MHRPEPFFRGVAQDRRPELKASPWRERAVIVGILVGSLLVQDVQASS
jgi:hypothetical protein